MTLKIARRDNSLRDAFPFPAHLTVNSLAIALALHGVAACSQKVAGIAARTPVA
jgi:hypothetical protein